MTARRLVINAKTRPYPLAVVSPGHFDCVDGGAVDARTVIERPEVSLYCLDPERRQAIFVETAPDVDLCDTPFYYQAQYAEARSLITVPYDTLHGLADQVRLDPTQLILVYSVGRCGSTLVSRALGRVKGVASLSEPDVFTQLAALRGTGGDEAELSQLVRSCTQVTCAPDGATGGWALKFRSFGVELADLFHRHYPQARVVFLYRNAGSWARSAARAFQPDEPLTLETMLELLERIGQLCPALRAYAEQKGGLLTRMEFMGGLWVSLMDRALAMQRRRAPVFVTRYEDLKADPHLVLTALFVHCGLPPAEPELLDRVLTQDSQAGSELAREAVRERSTGALTETDLAELELAIAELSPILTAGYVMPNTYGAR